MEILTFKITLSQSKITLKMKQDIGLLKMTQMAEQILSSKVKHS